MALPEKSTVRTMHYLTANSKLQDNVLGKWHKAIIGKENYK